MTSLDLYKEFSETTMPIFIVHDNDVTFCNTVGCDDCKVYDSCDNLHPINTPTLSLDEYREIVQQHPELLI